MKLFYDSGCNLCLNTVAFFRSYVKPRDVEIISVFDSDLSDQMKEKALNEMLLTSESGVMYWGYQTYIKLFSLSTGSFSAVFKFMSFLFRLPLINCIGNSVYLQIAKNRMSCSLSKGNC